MKIQENILYLSYYLRETNFCLTAINFSDRKCVNRIKPNKYFNASTYNSDKIHNRLKQKAVEIKINFRTKLNILHNVDTEIYLHKIS